MASGGFTYIQLRKLVSLASTRIFGDERRYVEDLIPYFVNSAYHEIDRRLRWTRCTYTITTVAAQDEYVVPSSVREYLHVEYTDAEGNLTVLAPYDWVEWTEAKATDSMAGTPTHYVQHGDRVYLYPTPDTNGESVTIYVVMEPPALSDDSDKPGFPVHLHQLVVDQALAYLYRSFGKWDEYLKLSAVVDHVIARERKDAAVQRGGAGRVRQRGA